MKKCIILTLTGLFINHILNAQETHPERMITTGSLFEEMIDMKSLAEFPYPFYKMVQYSSYDHRSTMPGGPDWYANSDGFGGEPVANFEEVLKEPDENGVGIYLIADVDFWVYDPLTDRWYYKPKQDTLNEAPQPAQSGLKINSNLTSLNIGVSRSSGSLSQTTQRLLG